MVPGRIRAVLAEHGPLAVACAGLVAFGVYLRFVDLGFPGALTWDEHHFVINARNYIHHEHDWNDHPPLGKLLIALGMLGLGDTSFGWRIVPALSGVASIGLAYLLGARLFPDRRAGWLAAAFVAADGFFIAYSRTALLDGMLTTLVLGVVLAAVSAVSPLHFLGVGLLIGLSASIKVSAVALGLPVALLCLVRPRRIPSLLSLGSAAVSFTAVWCLGLWLAEEPSTPVDALRRAASLLVAQTGANQFTHPLTSHWYTWFLPRRPITLRFDQVGPGTVRVSSSLGNLLLWWTAALTFFSSAGLAVRTVALAARARTLEVELEPGTRSLLVLYSFALSMLLPWTLGARDSYIYHYLPTYAVLLVMTAGVVAGEYERRRIPALGFVLAVGLVSAFYAPVWAQLPVTPRAFEQRLFLPMWR